MTITVVYSSSKHIILRYIDFYEGLSPCEFDLIPKMKEPLRGIRFRTIPEILQAVDRSIRTINTTGAAKVSYDFQIADNGLYTMLVTTLKDSKTFETCIYFVSVVNK